MALAIAHTILNRLCWARIPLQVDTGMWAYIGGRILDGKLPYRDVWDQKPPGIFYLFGGLEHLFGRATVMPFLCLDAVVTLGICAVIFVLIRRLLAAMTESVADRDAIFPAGAAVLLLSIVLGHRALADWGCNVEKFVAFFESMALLALLQLFTSRKLVVPRERHKKMGDPNRSDRAGSSVRPSLLAGVCCGLAGLFKQNAIFLPIIVTAVTLVTRLTKRSDRSSPRGVAFFWFWFGIALPWLPVAAWVISNGLLNDFWRDVMGYGFGRMGGATTELPTIATPDHWHQVWDSIALAGVVLLPAAIAIVFLIRRHAKRSGSFLFITTIQAILAVGVMALAPKGYGHYLLQAAPYAAILIAAMISDLGRPDAIWRLTLAAAVIVGAVPLTDHFQFLFNPGYQYRAAYDVLASRQREVIGCAISMSQPGQSVVIWPPDHAASWYADRTTPFEITNLTVRYPGWTVLQAELERQAPAIVLDSTPVRIEMLPQGGHDERVMLVPKNGLSLAAEPDEHDPDEANRSLAPMRRWLREHYGGQIRAGSVTVYRRGEKWREWQDYFPVAGGSDGAH